MDKAVRKAPDLDMGGMLALVKRHPLTTFLILAHLVIVITGPPSYRARTTNRKKHFPALGTGRTRAMSVILRCRGSRRRNLRAQVEVLAGTGARQGRSIQANDV
jgi:hypothetical protein